MEFKYIQTADETRYLASEALAHIAALPAEEAKAEIVRLFNLSQPTATEAAPEGQE